MTQFKLLGQSGSTTGTSCNSWAQGTYYGLGIQAPAQIGVDFPAGDAYDRFIGHGGMGYGCSSASAYDRKSDLAISAAGAFESTTGPSYGEGQIWQEVYQTFATSPMFFSHSTPVVV